MSAKMTTFSKVDVSKMDLSEYEDEPVQQTCAMHAPTPPRPPFVTPHAFSQQLSRCRAKPPRCFHKLRSAARPAVARRSAPRPAPARRSRLRILHPPRLYRPHPSQQGISVDGMGDMGGGMSGAGLGLPPDDEDEEWKACNCESRDKGTKYDLSKGKKKIIKKLIRACPDENKVYIYIYIYIYMHPPPLTTTP